MFKILRCLFITAQEQKGNAGQLCLPADRWITILPDATESRENFSSQAIQSRLGLPPSFSLCLTPSPRINMEIKPGRIFRRYASVIFLLFSSFLTRLASKWPHTQSWTQWSPQLFAPTDESEEGLASHQTCGIIHSFGLDDTSQKKKNVQELTGFQKEHVKKFAIHHGFT